MKKIVSVLLFISISIFANDSAILDNKKLLQIKSNELVNKGEYEKAVALIQKGIEKYPQNDYLLALLGSSYKGLRDIQKAELYFQEALQINPNNEFALAFIEETKKTKEMLKNETREDITTFLKDKGADLFLIFLGFLAGEIFASFILRSNKGNWRILLLSAKLKEKHKYYLLIPKYFVKYVLSSVFLRNLLIYFSILTLLVFFILAFEIVFETSSLQNIKTNKELWAHIKTLALYSVIALSIIWLLRSIFLKRREKECELIFLEIIHKIYQDQDVVELHDICSAMSSMQTTDAFRKRFDVLVKKYIIDENERDFLLNIGYELEKK